MRSHHGRLSSLGVWIFTFSLATSASKVATRFSRSTVAICFHLVGTRFPSMNLFQTALAGSIQRSGLLIASEPRSKELAPEEALATHLCPGQIVIIGAGSLQGLLPGAPTDPGVHVKCTRFVTLWNRCPPHDWVVSR